MRRPRIAILNPRSGNYVPVDVPLRELPRILKTLDAIEWLREHNPKGYIKIKKLLAKFRNENRKKR